MSSREAKPARLDVVDLRAYLPAIYSGARALRERQRWAMSSAFLPLMAMQSAEDADALDRLADLVNGAAGDT